MQGIAQLVMLGVGGFVLWQWYQNRQAEPGSGELPGGTTGGGGSTTQPSGGGSTSGGTTGGGTSTTTTGGSTGGGDTQTSGTQTGGSGGSSTPQLTVAQITPLAAAGNTAWAAVLDSRNVRYNVDQWNYYRVQGGQPAIAPEDMDILVLPDEDRQQALLATEYLSRLQRLNVGLSGLAVRSVWET